MKIVLLDGNSLGKDLDLSIFESLGETKIYNFTSQEELIHRIKDAEIIITNKLVLNESNLKYAKNLKLICVTGTGTNNIDKNYTLKKGISVANVVNYSTESVAQLTFSILLYLYGNLPYYDNYVKLGIYINDKEYKHYENRFFELNGKTWGVIGMGNIGKRVAEIASVFGCNIIYYSTSGKNKFDKYTNVDLEKLLKASDIISIHAPLNQDTKDLIGYRELKLMKRSAYILNLGRGGIINENDLVRAIEEDLLQGVGIDVLESEPMDEKSPFLRVINNPKLYITPHIGWASYEARTTMIKEVYKNIEAYKNNEERNIVYS